jgi:hypothetical protein
MLDATTGVTLQFILDVFSSVLLHDSGFPYEQRVYFVFLFLKLDYESCNHNVSECHIIIADIVLSGHGVGVDRLTTFMEQQMALNMVQL